MLSLGTGQAPGKSFGPKLTSIIDALSKLATDTQKKANSFRAEHQSMVTQQRLFRFDVTHGLADVGLEEYKALNVIADATQHYLDSQEIAEERRRCAVSLYNILNPVQPDTTRFSASPDGDRQSSQGTRSIMPPPAQQEQCTFEHGPDYHISGRQASTATMRQGTCRYFPTE